MPTHRHEFGFDFMITGRSLRVFLLESEASGEESARAQRAFALVSEAFVKAAVDRVKL